MPPIAELPDQVEVKADVAELPDQVEVKASVAELLRRRRRDFIRLCACLMVVSGLRRCYAGNGDRSGRASAVAFHQPGRLRP
jgi:hypothetical protein